MILQIFCLMVLFQSKYNLNFLPTQKYMKLCTAISLNFLSSHHRKNPNTFKTITVGLTTAPDCIIPQQLKDSFKIFDDDDTTCQRLDIEAGVASIKLEVKPSCVNTTDVSNQSVTLKQCCQY